MSAAVETFIFDDHKLRNVSIGETTATKLLGLVGGVLATASTLYEEWVMIAEKPVPCDDYV